MKTRSVAETFLHRHDIPYDIDDRGRITAYGNIDLSSQNLSALPDLSAVHLVGNFNCSNNDLASLKGAPAQVYGAFYCNNNRLETLAGGPAHVGGLYVCSKNRLSSLAHAPRFLHGLFDCDDNPLQSLTGAPAVVLGDFSCERCGLDTLKGGPLYVGQEMFIRSNNLTTLDGAPLYVGSHFNCGRNRLTSLAGCPFVGDTVYAQGNPLQTLFGVKAGGARVETDGRIYENRIPPEDRVPPAGYKPPRAKTSPLLKYLREELNITCLPAADGRIVAITPVDLSGMGLDALPDMTSVIAINGFDCSGNNLTTLAGAPALVFHAFSCASNRLSSLAGAPQGMMNFNCAGNRLESLAGAPVFTPHSFDCRRNALHALEHLPPHFTIAYTDFGDFTRIDQIPRDKRICHVTREREIFNVAVLSRPLPLPPRGAFKKPKPPRA